MATKSKLGEGIQIKNINDLKRGDVLFKYADDNTGYIITFLQSTTTYTSDNQQRIAKLETALKSGGENIRKLSHMLIYVGNGKVVEAVSDGIKINSLVEGHNKDCKFEVFHCNNHEMAKYAVEYALLANAAGGSYNYTQLYGGIARRIPGLISGGVKEVANAADKKSGGILGGAWRLVGKGASIGASVVAFPFKKGAQLAEGAYNDLAPDLLKKVAGGAADIASGGAKLVGGTVQDGLKLVGKHGPGFTKDIALFANEILNGDETIEKYEVRLKKLQEVIRNDKNPVNFFCSEMAAFCYDMACLYLNRPKIVNAPSSLVTPLDYIMELWGNNQFDYAGTLQPKALTMLKADTRNTMEANDYLQKDECLFALNGKYKLCYQADGNLVITDLTTNKPTWASNSNTGSAWLTFMQKDGHLVIYSDKTKKVAWSSNKYGPQYADSKLVLGDDGLLRCFDQNNAVYWSNK